MGKAIKRWSPRHDMVVQLHVACKSNKEIAEMTGYTPERVSQILSDPTALKLIDRAQEQLRERLSEEIETGLVAVCAKALHNIRETIELEGLPHGTDFKRHQDRLSYDVLKGTGFLSGEKEQSIVDEKPLTKALAERLTTALEKSNEAAQIQHKLKEIEVQEVEEVSREGDFVKVGED